MTGPPFGNIFTDSIRGLVRTPARPHTKEVTTALLLSALLAAALAADQTPKSMPVCVRPTKTGFDEPKTLHGLLACQEKGRAALGGDDAARDALDDLQRDETRRYLARHPDRADSGAGEKAPSEKVAAQKVRSRAAVQTNAQRLPEADRQGLQDLNEALWKMSGDGELGLTPAMAKEIAGYLGKQQGGVSAEMSALLGSLEKDGAKLTDGSVRQLKKAARDAKGEGLELGVEPGMEKWLLDPATDPEAGAKDKTPAVD